MSQHTDETIIMIHDHLKCIKIRKLEFTFNDLFNSSTGISQNVINWLLHFQQMSKPIDPTPLGAATKFLQLYIITFDYYF
ncbi:uncharacterized protein PRCAT00001764001 [Priceomyces carsonii]|uniref:uncharacterized protein n=1 Tax=Priceomyces carsonii TaxID=28549 RepID=UPI002EDA1462|nr:unnamed protein product [Priceomyces carsonii]